MEPLREPLRKPRSPLRRALGIALTALGLVYFLLDALALYVMAPLLGWIGRQPFVLAVQRRVAGLGPYPTLVLVLVPLVLLEPLKLLGAWVVVTGHPVQGGTLVVVGELLKVVAVERLFRFGRDKLLTIRWFAWLYHRAVALLERLRASPPWQAAARAAAAVKTAARRAVNRIRQALSPTE